jgi:four helix bundle protein
LNYPEQAQSLRTPRGKNMTVRAYTDLTVWKEAMRLAEQCYVATRTFGTEERYGLVSQMRRAAVSIPANIAEGHNRRSDRVLHYHLGVALGSQAEFETEVELCLRLELIPRDTEHELLAQAARVGQLLSGLRRRLIRGDQS